MQLINHDAMAQAFPDGLLVLPEHLAALITHAPTRAFLRDVGLPDRERWFESSQELVDGRVRIGGEAWQRVAEQHPGCPFDMSAWLALGGIGLDGVAVDTATGLVYSMPDGGSSHLLNSSVQCLGSFLYALEVERGAYDPEADGGADPDGAVERLLELMRAVDPAAARHAAPEYEYGGPTWSMVLHYVSNMLGD
ncbi:SUKH-4 family immunity protein [Kitasatospora sp. NPDC058162]|uniref:SUKH-4 family immunity protein n=1 Tax=Kitasatospora sp. NPDC058162 TaxID=3346362 RepID=UPI0036DBBF33